MKGFLLQFFCLLFAQALFAQTHLNFWTRVSFIHELNAKTKIELELQHRQQSVMHQNNPFEKPLTSSVRPWLYYKKNEQLSLAFSPVAFFEHHKQIQSYADLNLKPFTELRSALSAELNNKLSGRFTFLNRTGLEYRIFIGSPNVVRARDRIVLKYKYKKIQIGFGDEIFINVSANNASKIFDHNRIIASAAAVVHKNCTLELNYLRIQRNAGQTVPDIHEPNFAMNWLLRL